MKHGTIIDLGLASTCTKGFGGSLVEFTSLGGAICANAFTLTVAGRVGCN